MCASECLGRGEDTVGNPRRAKISQFELFEPIPILKVDKQLPFERFEAAGSRSTVPSPPLRRPPAWPSRGCRSPPSAT